MFKTNEGVLIPREEIEKVWYDQGKVKPKHANKRNKKHKIRVATTIDEETMNVLDVIKENSGLSYAVIVREAIYDYLNRYACDYEGNNIKSKLYSVAM